jgi:hypothetical protein
VEVVVETRVVSWDDDPDMEMRLTARRRGLAWWELRWSGVAGLEYRVRIPGGAGESEPVRCPAASP